MRWSRVEPILRATYALLDETDHVAGADVIASMDSPPEQDAARRAFWELHETGYLKAVFTMGEPFPVMIDATERGLQYASDWPGAPGGVEAFLSVLDERIADEATPDEQRSRLRRLRDAAADVGTGVMAEVITKLIEHQAGI